MPVEKEIHAYLVDFFKTLGDAKPEVTAYHWKATPLKERMTRYEASERFSFFADNSVNCVRIMTSDVMIKNTPTMAQTSLRSF